VRPTGVSTVYLTVIYGINIAPLVTVCLHCGTINIEGALFCAKCGYTLPQVEAAPPPVPPPIPPLVPGASPPPRPNVGSPAAFVVLGATGGMPTGPIAPPPSGKYCIRCRTIISRAAVYCPVCQQPQTP
jgi:RNA polymerase subunit RPABC4/transcription elongation factor Spt4